MGKDNKELFYILREVLLKLLAISSQAAQKQRKLDNLSVAEELETKVIPVYEKEYILLNDENFLKNIENEKLEKIIDELIKTKKNFFSKDIILLEVEKRKKLKGKSGAEVVKRLFEYELKELKKIFYKLDKTAKDLFNIEKNIEKKILDTIQEDELLKLTSELQDLKEKYSHIYEEHNLYKNKIEELENKLDKKWYYEIYGTVPEEALKGVFDKVFINDNGGKNIESNFEN